ncbi:MAG TPA: ABC transporter permease [Acholeplasmataceae bacterium]|nr:ABC transporter permease [Acholeplasmataceae bacterium]
MLLNILTDSFQEGLVWAIMALGIFISFRVLDFADLTSEGTLTLGAAIAAILIIKGVNPLLATIIAFFGGMLAGTITGLLHTKLKIPGILAGIITMTGLYSVNLKVMGKASLYIGDNKTVFSYINMLFDNRALSKTLTALLVVIIIFLVLYWFFGTEIGMSVRTTGMNQKMSKSLGINTDLMIILGLALANGLVALSGSLIAQKMASSNMDIGKGTIVIGLASIIIGEAIIGKKSFKVWLIAIIVGSFVYQLLIAIAINLLGMNPNDLKLLQAILVAIILGMPLITKAIKNRKVNKELKSC